MKFAAIADVHGNLAALEAVLADIAALGIENIVSLGDHLSGPLEPAQTADLLIARNIPSISGDQDRRLVTLHKSGPHVVRRPDYRQLKEKHFAWLAAMEPTMMYADDVFLCHGSPKSDTTYWLDQVTEDGDIALRPIAEIEAEAAGVDASLILCGHTHIPRVVRLRDGRFVVNAGSVGCPGYVGSDPVPHVVQTGTPDACYAVLEHTLLGWQATFRYVPYDPTAMARLAELNGAPAWSRAVSTGWLE